MDVKKTGLLLKQLRERSGLSQRTVYEKFGVKQSTFSSWERGVSEPPLSIFFELMMFYGATPMEVFGPFGYTVPDDPVKLDNDEIELLRNYRKLSDYNRWTVQLVTSRLVNGSNQEPEK